MKLTGISHQIWHEKYRYKAADGEPVDETVNDTFLRVARALAEVEKEPDRDRYTSEFFDAMRDFSVIPAGRILSGAGTKRDVTLMNCYVMGVIPDSLDGIYNALRESALTLRAGGGIGNDFSTLRPKGALITKLGSGSSGPLAFMDSWDAMCRSIMSAGHRRGAMMGTLRCDHPDIEAFIEAKRDPHRWRMFNVSVLVTDRFMEAVQADDGWNLEFKGKVYKTVRARALWEKIMRSTYDYADPGVIFIDRVNETNPLREIETLSCTNPCGEQPLPPYGACDLGSINLARMVSRPYQPDASINWGKLEHCVATLVRMLDNVLDVTNYPLEQQREEAMLKRRIGIGVTGLANMFTMLGVKYSSDEARVLTDEVMKFIRITAETASTKLGEEKGNYPLLQRLSDPPKYRRNSHLTSIAPTGTISLFAGNVSSGIEPIFDLEVERRILQKDDTWQTVRIKDYGYGVYSALRDGGELIEGVEPTIWETAAQLTPDDHLDILAAAQRHVDSSVSKTINCPEDISYEEFREIYARAYRMGCKSCTTYRPNKTTGSIIQSETMKVKEGDSNVVELTKPLTRPETLQGTTYRLKPAGSQHALFITINDIEQGGVRRPFEIFINTKDTEFVAWSTALTRMISAIFRRGGDISFVPEELKSVFDPQGGYWDKEKYVPSLIAGIGNVIQQHLATLGQESATAPSARRARCRCPECHQHLVSKDGCWACPSCSYSACG